MCHFTKASSFLLAVIAVIVCIRSLSFIAPAFVLKSKNPSAVTTDPIAVVHKDNHDAANISGYAVLEMDTNIITNESIFLRKTNNAAKLEGHDALKINTRVITNESIVETNGAANIPLDDELKINLDNARYSRSSDQTALRLSSIKPIVWVHIPKTGTSFITPLVFGVCPKWPETWVFQVKRGIPKNFETHRLEEHCTNGFEEKYISPSQYAHIGILSEDFYQRKKGKFVGMFRKPELRMLSAWFNDNPGPWGDPEEISLPRYARNYRGCMVKSLTRGKISPCKMKKPVSNKETKLAIRRLEGFAFIGLTDYWDLSICLWHTMFGGPIFLDELKNVRPGERQSKEKETALSIIRKFPDVADEAVFSAAEKIFWDNIRLHGVTNETCALAVAQAVNRSE